MSRDDLLIERVHLGEASETERARVQGDPSLAARLRALDASDVDFRDRFPAEAQLGAIRRKAHLAETRAAWSRRKAALGGVGVLVPLLAAAGLLLAQPELLTGRDAEVIEERAKGSPHLVVHRATADGEERMPEGSVARAGDVLQLGIQSSGARHGVVVSIDGAGAVTLHHPSSVGGSTRLDRGEVALAHGYQLDEAPRFERFILVTSDQPIDAAAVVRASEALGTGAETAPLLLPPSLRQHSFLLRKADR